MKLKAKLIFKWIRKKIKQLLCEHYFVFTHECTNEHYMYTCDKCDKTLLD